jgi:hypothetical protein
MFLQVHFVRVFEVKANTAPTRHGPVLQSCLIRNQGVAANGSISTFRAGKGVPTVNAFLTPGFPHVSNHRM